ncbi:MAG: hypothetical protein JWN34_603 [Bryobacterales bacterium]|nr:hypothetical protein [Bryobacterales bacterium]
MGAAGWLHAFQAPVEFVCPMDKDVRSKTPGKCPRCGMPLEAGVREPVEYQLRVQIEPRSVPVGRAIEIRLELLDRSTRRRASKYELIHEKPFHLFIVSADLEFFIHDHPVPTGDGRFRYRTTLPKPGVYRILADCYPAGATPQLLPAFVTAGGYTKSIGESIASPAADLAPKRGENLQVSLRMDPPAPSPGRKTMLFFTAGPREGLERYLGAWGHLLAMSNDLIDSIHEHPVYGEPGIEIQFNIFFPRPATYRVWVQFQRKGVVNTVAFTIPVRELS